MVKKLLLRSVLIGSVVLGQLSFFIWLINYLHVNHTPNATVRQESLINNAQAESQMLASYAAPLMSPPQALAPKKTQIYQRTGVSNLQIKVLDKSHLQLNFPNDDFKITEEERDLLEQHLVNLNINQGRTVRLYIDTASNSSEENLITRPVSKLRAQSVARIIYPFTQNVEIVFTSQQHQAGSLVIDVNPAHATF